MSLFLLLALNVLPALAAGPAIVTEGIWGHGKISCLATPIDAAHLAGNYLNTHQDTYNSLIQLLERVKKSECSSVGNLDDLQRKLEKINSPIEKAVAANRSGRGIAGNLAERETLTKAGIDQIAASEKIMEEAVTESKEWAITADIPALSPDEMACRLVYSYDLAALQFALNEYGCQLIGTNLALTGKQQRMRSGVAYEIQSAGGYQGNASNDPYPLAPDARFSDVTGTSP